MITVTHAETVAAYPEQFSEPCRIVRSDWPYECGAKRVNPDDEVFTCEPHSVWWHRPAGEAHDFRAAPDAVYGHLVYASCTCGEWRTHGAVRVWLAVTMHRRHREAV